MSHSTVSALPAMSANSALGSGERSKVAINHRSGIRHRQAYRGTLTAKHNTKIPGVHQILFTVLGDPTVGFSIPLIR